MLISLLTSRLPPQLGITRNDGRNTDQDETRLRLADGVQTLAETLAASGYDTGAFTDNGFVDPRYGFGQGFAHFEMLSREEHVYRNGLRRQIPRVRAWLEARRRADDKRPFFLFLHTYDIHEPYVTAERFARAFSGLTHVELKEKLDYPPRPDLLNRHREDLAPEDVARVVAALAGDLQAWMAALERDAEAAGLLAVSQAQQGPDPAHEAALEALGYLRGDRDTAPAAEPLETDSTE